MMRLLFLTNFYPPHDIGGYEQWCQSVADRLAARGHAVTVLSSRWRRSNAITVHEPHVRRMLHLQADMNRYNLLAFFLRRRRYERENLTFLQQVVAEVVPDIVFVWGMWNLDRTLAQWLELSGMKVAYFISDLWPASSDIHEEFWCQPARRRLARPLKYALNRLALALLRREGKPIELRFEHAITVSQAIKDALISAGLPFQQAVVIHGGCEPELFPLRLPQVGRPPGRLALLYVGGLAPHKGVETLLQAMVHLAAQARNDGITLDLVGDGHPVYVEKIRKYVAEKGLSERIRFIGRLPRSELPKVMNAHDALAFTSECLEAFPRTPMEAMLSGLPVISTTTGGTAEIVESGVNALTFQAGNAQGLARQIERLAWDVPLAQRLADVGRASVLERFTIQQMVIAIEEYLLALTS